jgi:hypothetical protein
MNIGLFLQSRFFESLQNLFRNSGRGDPSTQRQSSSTPPGARQIDPEPIPGNLGSTSGRASEVTTTKPLRVVHVVEAGQGRTCVGRMVISGRMADVCAELDRLAACEVVQR